MIDNRVFRVTALTNYYCHCDGVTPCVLLCRLLFANKGYYNCAETADKAEDRAYTEGNGALSISNTCTRAIHICAYDCKYKRYNRNQCKQCSYILDVAVQLGNNKTDNGKYNTDTTYDCRNKGQYGKPFGLSLFVIAKEQCLCTTSRVGHIARRLIGHTFEQAKQTEVGFII